MKDQVQALVANGIPAAFINSTLNNNQTGKAIENAKNCKYKIIYVVPERLDTLITGEVAKAMGNIAATAEDMAAGTQQALLWISSDSYWNATIGYLSYLYFNSNNVLSSYADGGKTAAPLFNALYSKVFNPFERGDISNKLTEIVSSNPLIQSVYIYNKDSDTVFSDMTTPLTISNFFDKDIIERLKT